MKICRFRTNDDQESYGVLTKENIIYKIEGDIFIKALIFCLYFKLKLCQKN